MNYHEALRWLDDHGGAWCVRATKATCVVMATLGPAKAQAPARALRPADVNDALVTAVEELAEQMGSRTALR